MTVLGEDIVAISLTKEGRTLYKYFYSYYDPKLLSCMNGRGKYLEVCDEEGYYENNLERALALDERKWGTYSTTDPKEINRILMVEELMK